MAQEIDKDKFYRRLKRIYKFWVLSNDFFTREENDDFSKVDSFFVLLGMDDSVTYSKSLSIHHWLLGYELPDTLIAFCQNDIYFLCGKRKLEFLKQVENNDNIEDGMPSVHLLLRDKSDKDKTNFQKIIQALKNSGKGESCGEFVKDKLTGEFGETWRDSFGKETFETVDVSPFFANLFATKDQQEIGLIKNACEATCTFFNKYVKDRLINIVDSEQRVKHSTFAKEIEDEFTKKAKKYVPNLDRSQLDVCYPPIVQSGGKYNFKFSATSDDSTLHFGAIVVSLGLRYWQYCSNIVRTMFVDPSEELQNIYSLLLDIEQKAIETMKPGAKFSDVYEACMALVQSKKPELVETFTKTLGFVMGIEFRESSMVINAKNSTIIEAGMIFNLNLGFANVPNPSAKDSAGKTVAMFVGDTVLITNEGGQSLTEASKKRVKSVCMFFKNEEEEKDDNNKENISEILGRVKRSVVLDDQLRKKASGEDKRKQHQKELAEKLNKEAQERLAQSKDSVSDQKVKKSTISYKNYASMPQEKEVKSGQIYVDKRYESVILPIFGMAVPFHISTIKNISQSIEGDFTYLRVNFFFPGTTMSKESGFQKPDAEFLKEITYRSSNLKEPGELYAPSSNLNTAFRLIKEVQKKFKTREAEEREKEGIVKQDKLIVNPNKTNPRLKDLYIRPNIVSKKISGSLEAHTNGFRYTSIRGDKLDILYNNIKHAFFQPCDKEMIILLHFHLKNAILFGKRKHVDIQFFTEVGEITTDLGKHTHMHDRDDLYAEQAERDLRHKLNMAFKNFTEKVENLTKQELEFDTPFRELGFFGVPHRSSVLLQPTSSCLVNLTDWPPFLVTLDEVELVHFERVQFQLKNFDMVFIFKDYVKKVAVVTAIEMKMLDHVKEWLDSCEIRYTEGIQSLNWPKIMKTILDDPEGFFENGGWNFLNTESDDEGEGGGAGADSDSDEDDEAFVPSGESEGEEDESEDDYESEATEESDSGSSGGSDDEEEEESGKSWSELEEEARKADQEKHEVVEEDDRKIKRKAGKPPSSHQPPNKKRR
uniref:FACT complex subunit n=1 Tax=Romanomermis culicivorax TaxID=13658 RepID=A0A915IGG8_ROMCU